METIQIDYDQEQLRAKTIRQDISLVIPLIIKPPILKIKATRKQYQREWYQCCVQNERRTADGARVVCKKQ